VAIKQLKMHLLKFDDTVRQDFYREVESMERLRCPQIVLFTYGWIPAVPFSETHSCLQPNREL